MRRRTRAGFTDADANAGDGQLPEVLRKTAHRSHGTPDGNGPGNNVAAVGAVGKDRDRNTQGCVEQGKGDAGQEAQLGVRQQQVGLQGFDQDTDDVAVDVAGRVGQDQNQQRVASIGGGNAMTDVLRVSRGVWRLGHVLSPAFVVLRREYVVPQIVTINRMAAFVAKL